MANLSLSLRFQLLWMCTLVLGGAVWAGIQVPGVQSLAVETVTEQSAELRGKVIDDLGKICYTWFSYREVGLTEWQNTPVRYGATTGGGISETVENLKPGIPYEYRAHVRNYAGESVGVPLGFFTWGQENSLTIGASSGGMVILPGEGYFTYGLDASQALDAQADHGHGFYNWTGSSVERGNVVEPNAPYTVAYVDSNDTLEANFTSLLNDSCWQWQTLNTNGKPTGRHETSFVNCGGKFYMIGGRESQRVDRFDPETKTWSKMQVQTPKIHHYQPVVWHNKIYMVGAMTGNYPAEPPMSHVQIYDPVEDTWTQGHEIPADRRRGGAGTVVYNDKIYMAGGITLGHTSGTNAWFDEYDPATGVWTQLPDAPHIRDHFHAVVLDDKLYCIGGRNTSYHTPGNFGAFFGATEPAIDVYDFKTGTWSTLASPLPAPSAAAGVVVINGIILYFGGETASSSINPTTWAFDPQNETWKPLAEMKQGRHGSQAVVYDGRVYISAGSPKRGGGNVNSTEMFSPYAPPKTPGRR